MILCRNHIQNDFFQLMNDQKDYLAKLSNKDNIYISVTFYKFHEQAMRDPSYCIK